MSTNTTENITGEPAVPPLKLYSDAIELYLEAADWIGPVDQPFVVHARAIAGSLDRQLNDRGEIQSALASSFDKVMVRLEARRPPPPPAPTDPLADGPAGTASIFTQLD